MDSVASRPSRETKPPAGLAQRVEQERTRMLFAHVPLTSLASGGFAVTVAWFVWQVMPTLTLWPWLSFKLLAVAARVLHAVAYRRSSQTGARHWYTVFVALVLVDGLSWGAIGWWLAPVGQLNLAVTATLCCLLGISAAGAFMLSTDLRSAAAFIGPILLPNAVYCLSRGDAYGWLGGMGLPWFMLILLMETRRTQRRIIELLQLRFESEELAEARAQALAQAQQLSDSKSRFLATMSHELRTPLHGILGLTRLLREDAQPQHLPRRLDLIECTGQHLLHVVSDIQDLSKIEAGRLEIAHQPFDLSALIAEVAEVSRVSAAQRRLSLKVDHGLPRKHMVVGDAARVRQVLHNLLGNAIKFTDQGDVLLQAWRNERTGQLHLRVRDSGVGIAEQELARIFEAFHQVDSSFERRYSGTGLGLTISRELCRAMGGDLECSSKLGEGSVFTCTLYLPVWSQQRSFSSPADRRLRAAPRERAPQAQAAAAAGLPGHVLLVEDNPVNALVAEAELQLMGVQVSTVRTGRQAIEWLDAQSADLVLMDCQMPEMDGFEATRQIRQREHHTGRDPVPIVALTANVRVEDRTRCLDAGMNDHLPKPFHREQLQGLLSRYARAAPTRLGQASL